MKRSVVVPCLAALLLGLSSAPLLAQPHAGPPGPQAGPPGAPPGPNPMNDPIFHKFMQDRQAGNKQAAIADLEAGVAKHNVNAEAQLGEEYRGVDAELAGSVKIDYNKSLQLTRQAIAQGSTRAMTDLGVAYMRGQGVPKNGVKALQYLKKATAAGDRKAPRYIGLVYENGVGVPVDYAQAAKYYQQAASAADITGQCLIGSLYERGLGVAPDYDRAEAFYVQSSQRGDIIASGGMVALGNLFETRGDGKRNLQTAMSWYRKAADQNNSAAKADLARLAAGNPLPVGTMRNVCMEGHPG